ncbi:uncharacterized protein C8Q71DRAFT_730269 [Rhodofomes roseus]|uniref:Uncharacterized protein n=1 Tax=Rhodofomes roseus TaxID=34475 RepID=A0ABQ8KX13_9APHY|nr:uncharacterized protein C8Q71DRAFT_730269 [Rhodofomes roseus]KAH9843843.1 hypothetical protein C8Q71DRAFT_730269 [Rhodofomes roseus]
MACARRRISRRAATPRQVSVRIWLALAMLPLVWCGRECGCARCMLSLGLRVAMRVDGARGAGGEGGVAGGELEGRHAAGAGRRRG